MKYLTFKDDDTGVIMPVIFPDHVVHAQVKIEGATPISGGAVTFKETPSLLTPVQATVFGNAQSVALKPSLSDDALLTATLSNHGIYSFMPSENPEGEQGALL